MSCPDCYGTGVDDARVELCPTCRGRCVPGSTYQEATMTTEHNDEPIDEQRRRLPDTPRLPSSLPRLPVMVAREFTHVNPFGDSQPEAGFLIEYNGCEIQLYLQPTATQMGGGKSLTFMVRQGVGADSDAVLTTFTVTPHDVDEDTEEDA